MQPLTTKVMLTASDVSLLVSALLDSSSAGNFISGRLCHQQPPDYNHPDHLPRPVDNGETT